MDERPDCESANRWLLVALLALGGLVLWVGWNNLAHRQDYLRATLLTVAVALYLTLVASRRLHAFFKARDYRGYFTTGFAITSGLIYLAGTATPAWLLLLPLASQAVLFLPLREIPFALIAFFLVGLYPPRSNWHYQALNLAACFCFTGAFSWMVRREAESRFQLQAANRKLREYSAQVEALAAAEERARLAREIHDGVAHHLTSANVLLAAGVGQLPEDTSHAVRDSLQKAGGQIRAALQEIRESIAQRRELSSASPLAERIEQLIQAGNFPASLALFGSARRLTSEVEFALYRVAQEALTNARKHAPGATIRMELDFSESHRARLHIENPEPAVSPSGDGAFGLLSLRERVTRLGGKFEAGSENSGVFVVRAEIPT